MNLLINKQYISKHNNFVKTESKFEGADFFNFKNMFKNIKTLTLKEHRHFQRLFLRAILIWNTLEKLN